MMEGRISEEFAPRRMEPCFCGSGERFKRCCGTTNVPRKPPHGVELRPGYLPEDDCVQWVGYLEGCPGERLKVIDPLNSTPENVVRMLDDRRITEKVDAGDRHTEIIDHVQSIMKNIVEPVYDCEIEWFENPQVLRYRPGGFYAGHSDSEHYDVDQKHWVRDLDRDISLLMYLNDDFQGGGISFKRFNFTHQPKAGDLLVFPSDQRYLHEAESLLSGVRYAIVSWAAMKGRPRVLEEPPNQSVFL